MKRLNLLILTLLLPLLTVAQVKTFSPSGTRISTTPSVTITNSTTETTLFSDIIQANSLVPGKYYPFRIDLALTTPLVNLANVTIRVKYGSQTLTVINGAGLTIGMTSAVPVTITGYIVSRGMNSQFIPIVVSQGMGSAIVLSNTNTIARGTMTVDSSVDQNFSITAQFGGVGANASILSVDWVLRSDF